MTEPTLSSRQIRTYNLFQKQMAVLLLVLRKPKLGPAGPDTIAACNNAIRLANKVFPRELGVPPLPQLFHQSLVSQHDLTVNVLNLAVIALEFEQLFKALTIPPEPPMPPRPPREEDWLDADGLPDKHLYPRARKN